MSTACSSSVTAIPIVVPATTSIETRLQTDGATTSTFFTTHFLPVRWTSFPSLRTQASTTTTRSTITAPGCSATRTSSTVRSSSSSESDAVSLSILGPPVSVFSSSASLSLLLPTSTSLEPASVPESASPARPSSHSATPTTASEAASPDSSSQTTWLPGVIGALSIVTIAITVIAYFYMRRRHRQRERAAIAGTVQDTEIGRWSSGSPRQTAERGRDQDSWQCAGLKTDDQPQAQLVISSRSSPPLPPVPPLKSSIGGPMPIKSAMRTTRASPPAHSTMLAPMPIMRGLQSSSESVIDPGPRPVTRKAVPPRQPTPIIVNQPPAPGVAPWDEHSPPRSRSPSPVSRLNIRSIANFRLPSIPLSGSLTRAGSAVD